MKSLGPIRIDPTGAPTPLDKQKLIVSHGLHNVFTSILQEAATFMIRDPSICNFILFFLHKSEHFSTKSIDNIRPPHQF